MTQIRINAWPCNVSAIYLQNTCKTASLWEISKNYYCLIQEKQEIYAYQNIIWNYQLHSLILINFLKYFLHKFYVETMIQRWTLLRVGKCQKTFKTTVEWETWAEVLWKLTEEVWIQKLFYLWKQLYRQRKSTRNTSSFKKYLFLQSLRYGYSENFLRILQGRGGVNLV